MSLTKVEPLSIYALSTSRSMKKWIYGRNYSKYQKWKHLFATSIQLIEMSFWKQLRRTDLSLGNNYHCSQEPVHKLWYISMYKNWLIWRIPEVSSDRASRWIGLTVNTVKHVFMNLLRRMIQLINRSESCSWSSNFDERMDFLLTCGKLSTIAVPKTIQPSSSEGM